MHIVLPVWSLYQFLMGRQTADFERQVHKYNQKHVQEGKKHRPGFHLAASKYTKLRLHTRQLFHQAAREVSHVITVH